MWLVTLLTCDYSVLLRWTRAHYLSHVNNFVWKKLYFYWNVFSAHWKRPVAWNGLSKGTVQSNCLRSSHQRCSLKKVVLKNSQYSQENICGGVSFLIKLQALGLQLYWKETSTEMFSCEYCEISKYNYFQEHLRTAASVALEFITNIININEKVNSELPVITCSNIF